MKYNMASTIFKSGHHYLSSRATFSVEKKYPTNPTPEHAADIPYHVLIIHNSTLAPDMI